MMMRDQGQERETDFAGAVRAAVEHMREVSGADIVALYPYDEDTDTFYAPVAIGLADNDLVRALPDLADQLRRFRADQAEGKVPDDLQPSQYGSSAWLVATHRPLVTADAIRDADSSFVRRNKIYAIVGLPLLAGGRVIGLLYLNYVDHDDADGHGRIDVTEATHVARVEEAASEAALAIDAARRAEESAILQALSGLVGHFSALPLTVNDEGGVTLRLEAALHRVLLAAGLDAAALYDGDSGDATLTLVATYGCPTLAQAVRAIPDLDAEAIVADTAIANALADDDLHPLIALTPRGQGHQGVLLLADGDPLALQRGIPTRYTLLQTAADLLGTALDKGHLVEQLDESNRTLGAVTRLSNRLLQPGASQEKAMSTAVASLTDPNLPQLNFEFAAVYQLELMPEGGLQVAACAGATTSSNIDATPDATGNGAGARRVPRWVQTTRRALDPHDVVSYVAMRRRAVVVAARNAPDDDLFVNGYPEDRLERLQIALLHRDGSSDGAVRAARLRGHADRAPTRTADADDTGAAYRVTDEFTLDADLFAGYDHASLVRVFVPFGSDATGERAAGVLEAGFHISHQNRLERVEIEALRASAATVAAALENARLYEEATKRARQLEIVSEVSRAIAVSIDLEQTLGLVARNMARAVDASVCLIALLEEDGSAWYGAASSDSEDIWRQRRVEHPEKSIVFEVAERKRSMVVEDALDHELVSAHFARVLGIRSLLVLPLVADEGDAIGAVLLGQRDRQRLFTAEEVDRTSGLVGQAAAAIYNARIHALEEEEQHIQKDVVLVGFGQWGQKAYQHLLLLKNFFNFRTHIVEHDRPGRREKMEQAVQGVLANGDLFYWDTPAAPARDALALELEPSCYVITYIATPAETHLPILKSYYPLSNVVLIEKPLGAPPDEYRAFLDRTDGSVQIVAADHYWFKTEVRLLQLLLTEERNLRSFLEDIEEVEIEILEEQPPTGSGAQIGMIADLIPHAFAILSLLTPLDRLTLAAHRPLQVARYQPLHSDHETYARLVGTFEHRGRQVRVTIDVGKGVVNAKSIKLSGERRMGGRRPFYKFDFTKGEAIDGTQSALRAATRPIRQPGVPDNAHLSMLRHVIEKKHPAVGILSIREALRANARIQQLEHTAADLIASGQWTPYEQGQRPPFPDEDPVQIAESRAAREEARVGR